MGKDKCYTIYLVEDEHNLNQLLTSYLEKEGWQVKSFYNGEDALNMVTSIPDLWILDIMLPDIDGYQLLKEIKNRRASTPVIYISARDAELDRVIGLEMGSDDYLPKPFLPRELVIRTRKILERVYGDAAGNKGIALEPYFIDISKRMVWEGAVSLELTTKEYDLLELLTGHLGQAWSREQILTQLWGYDYIGSDRVVDDLVRRLRKKMPRLPLETIYGYGYRMVHR